MSTLMEHQPVLFDEVLKALQVKPDGVYVDGTFGRGGHSAAILERLGDHGRLIVMDKDPQAIASARAQYTGDGRVTIIHDDYAHLFEHVQQQGVEGQVDGVLLDLGVSSPQLDDAGRGFSFQQNGPLDMRMDTSKGQTARDWVMTADEKEIADVLWRYGEERFSRRIARRIVEYRQQQPINDTNSLVTIIKECVPAPKGKNRKQNKHPATRSFQAIRMRINNELENIERVLSDIFNVLKLGGRLLVISFHSLEDRLVKQFFKKHSTPPKMPRGLPIRESELSVTIRLKLIGKAIKAGANELAQNPRSRSAVLRTAERVS